MKTLTATFLTVILLMSSLAPSFAGAIPGPKRDRFRLCANCYDRWQVSFRGGEMAEVFVSGDGDTDLDLYVYDSNGNLIASDEDDSDDCYVRWTPRWTGRFIIKVVNRGGVYNHFGIATN